MKNKSIDGLRGLAAFNVVISHFIAALLPMMLHKSYPTVFAENKNPSVVFETLTSPLFSIFYNGHFAVLIFFVLSGYVLTMPYFNGGVEHTLKKRLWGRYLRLNIPIAVSIALSFVVYKLNLYFNLQVFELSGSTTWLKNYFLPTITNSTAPMEALYQSIFFGSGNFIPPLWTLKIEFIGSLYILLFYMAKPRQLTALPVAVACLFLYAVYNTESIYFIAIFIGSCLNYLKMENKWNAVFFALGVYFGAFQFQSPLYDFLPQIQLLGVEMWERKAFYNAIGAIALIAAVINGFGVKFFESRFFQFLGMISFSMYLLHFIVLCSLSCAIYFWLPQTKFYLFVNFIIYIGVCFGFSKIFEKYVDRKSVTMAHKFSAYMFK